MNEWVILRILVYDDKLEKLVWSTASNQELKPMSKIETKNSSIRCVGNGASKRVANVLKSLKYVYLTLRKVKVCTGLECTMWRMMGDFLFDF